MKRIVISAAVVLLLMTPFGATGQSAKKQKGEWTDAEISRMLSNSAWGKTKSFLTVAPEVISRNNGRDLDRPTDYPASTFSVPHQMYFRVSLVSARPVREALSRMLMRPRDEKDEKVYDQIGGLLADFADEEPRESIVILLSSVADRESARLEEARSRLNKFKTDDLKSDTFLEVKGGKRVQLGEYRSYGPLGGVFVFPRLVAGEPLITDQSGEILFRTKLSKVIAIDIRFKPKDMIYEGKLEY